MRLCSEPSRGWSRVRPASHRSVITESCSGRRPAGGLDEEASEALGQGQGTEGFLGLVRAGGRVSTPPWEQPQCLDPEG